MMNFANAFFFSFICCLVPFAQADQTKLETLVRSTAEQALAKSYPERTYTLKVLPISGIDRLKPCVEMQASLRGNRLHGRVPVHVRCTHPASWSLYASVDIDVSLPVVVASRSIARGELILANALVLENHDVTSLRPQTLSSIEEATGMVARRAIRAGQTLSLNQLAAPNQVRKGERVQIVAASGRVRIHSFGTALSDGKLGEQIQVRNDKSKRVILPWITAPGTVSTRPPDITAQ